MKQTKGKGSSVDELYLTIDDVAERLQVSRVTVYAHINSGRLESIKFGRSRRVAASALRRFMVEQVDHREPKREPVQQVAA